MFNVPPMNPITQAVILAAGLGSRLKAYTEHQPKALMPISSQPAIAQVIRSLVASGVHDIVINLHHFGEQIQQQLDDGSSFNARLYYSKEAQLLDSGGGVRTAMNLLPKSDGLLVYNTDIIADIDIKKLASLCPEQGCALALVPNPKHHPQGDFALHGHDIALNSEQKFTFSGVSAWDKHVLFNHPNQQNFSLVQPIQASIAKQQCKGFLHQGYWFDIGRPHDLIQANRYYRELGL